MFAAAAPATAAPAVTLAANSRCSPPPPFLNVVGPSCCWQSPQVGGRGRRGRAYRPHRNCRRLYSLPLRPPSLSPLPRRRAWPTRPPPLLALLRSLPSRCRVSSASPLLNGARPMLCVRGWRASSGVDGRTDTLRCLRRRCLCCWPAFVVGGGGRGGGKGQDGKGGETAAYATAAAPTAAAAVPPPPPRSRLRRMVLLLAPSPLSPLPVPLTAIPIDCSFPPPPRPTAGRPVLFGQSMQWMGRSGTAWRRLCQPTPPLLPPLRPQTLRAPCLMVVKAAVPITFNRGVGRWTCWRRRGPGPPPRRRHGTPAARALFATVAQPLLDHPPLAQTA